MMTDKTAHELLTQLNEWSQEKRNRGEGWAPGQYSKLVEFLGVPLVETPKPEEHKWPKTTKGTPK